MLMNALNMGSMMALGGVLMVVVLVIALFYLVFYCLQSYGVMKIAQRHNVQHSWLAWIPVANAYIYGKIAFKSTTKAAALFALKVAPLTNILFLILGSDASSITNIFSFAYTIFLFYATYKIYKQMSDRAVMMLIFSALSGGTLIPIFLFAIRNNPINLQG